MSDRQQRTEKTARRQMLSSALLGATGGLLASTSAGAAEGESTTSSRIALRAEGAPSADSGYAPGILATGSKLVVISGQGPADYDADMEMQIRQTFDRIELLLKEAGATWANVVILRSFWVHLLRDLPIYRKVRKDYLVEPYPASTAVGTPELAIPGLELEIEAMAVL